MFGVSKGTVEELTYAIRNKKTVRTFLEEFDPEWRKYYLELGGEFIIGIDELLANL